MGELYGLLSKIMSYMRWCYYSLKYRLQENVISIHIHFTHD